MTYRYQAWLFCLCIAGNGALATGCGGAERERVNFDKAAVDKVAVDDIGSQPVSCAVSDDYELQMIQDFETESVTGGWYFNNDKCDKCEDVKDRIKEIDNLLNKARQLPWSTEEVNYVDKWGCHDWRFYTDDPADAAAAQKGYEKELAQLRQKLIDGDPATNVPANCSEVCAKSQTPIPNIKPILAARIEYLDVTSGKLKDKPRCGSRFAMHMQGGPFETWGGSVAVQLGQPGVDASEWEGLSFWARVGPTSRHPLRVEISDENTDDKQMVYTFPGDAAPTMVALEDLLDYDKDGKVVGMGYFDAPGDARTWCNAKNYTVSETDEKKIVNEKFICNGDSIREDRNGCDKFGANRSMTGDWQFYTIDFQSMRQSGWGRPATNAYGDPEGLNKAGLRSINFMWTTGTWDVWIDDVALYRRKQP